MGKQIMFRRSTQRVLKGNEVEVCLVQIGLKNGYIHQPVAHTYME